MDSSIWTSFVEWLRGFGAQAGQHAADAGVQLGGVVVEGVGAAASQLDMPSLFALAAALGWASGFRLYAVVFLVGAAGLAGWMPLPEGLQVLQHPAVLATSGALLFVEFFADKIPGLDSLWDLVNSVIRIPAGAALAAGVLGAGISGAGPTLFGWFDGRAAAERGAAAMRAAFIAQGIDASALATPVAGPAAAVIARDEGTEEAP